MPFNPRRRPFLMPAAGIRERMLIGVCGWLAWSAVSSGAEKNWTDIESRIQYGYYTEDARLLGGAVELLPQSESADAMQEYYGGLANYRLALLALTTDRSRAKEPVQRCIANLDRAVRARADFADALALQSACLDMLATLEPWRAAFAASRSGTQIERARQLAPGNPRVLLMKGVGDYERARSSSADRQRALEDFRRAAAAFEAERQQTEQVPGWGAAEAYTYLARCYLDAGDALRARDALEHALLLAPEFAQARRLMTKITTG